MKKSESTITDVTITSREVTPMNALTATPAVLAWDVRYTKDGTEYKVGNFESEDRAQAYADGLK